MECLEILSDSSLESLIVTRLSGWTAQLSSRHNIVRTFHLLILPIVAL